MKYLSLFSGIGGFELGIQQAYEDYQNRQQKPIGQGTVRDSSEQSGDISSIGSRRREYDEKEGHRMEQWLCIGYSEIDKHAVSVYEKHFNHKNYGDATTIKTNELPDFDLLVGGFPCQAFSIAGKRKGFDDTRGTLFFDIARILADKRPKHFILENVKGLLSHDTGNTFTTIIRVLTDLGYFVEWQVLNAKNFGVPQNRERVFIVGHLGGEPRPKVFPIGESNTGDIKGKRDDSKTARTVSARFRKGVGNTESRIIDVLVDGSQGQRIRDIKGLAQTLSGLGGGQGAKTGIYTDGLSVRRLTPLECERLMGYPDGWTQGASDTQRYKMCGNGIVSNVVKEVVKRLYGK